MGRVTTPLETVVIDGDVWLHAESKPGLGARLEEALGKRTPVIGVAKTPFAGARLGGAVVRGTSQRPEDFAFFPPRPSRTTAAQAC